MPPLTYTTEPPTQPGWYWMRLPWNAGSRRLLRVQVCHDRSGALQVYYSGAMLDLRPDTFPAGTQWSGPIPQPGEA